MITADGRCSREICRRIGLKIASFNRRRREEKNY